MPLSPKILGKLYYYYENRSKPLDYEPDKHRVDVLSHEVFTFYVGFLLRRARNKVVKSFKSSMLNILPIRFVDFCEIWRTW